MGSDQSRSDPHRCTRGAREAGSRQRSNDVLPRRRTAVARRLRKSQAAQPSLATRFLRNRLL